MAEPRLTARQRATIVHRACGCCEYCWAQERFAPDPFSVEHIVPSAKGGAHALANLVYACQGCNGRKYISTEAIDPATGETVALYHPRQHVWADHFAWSDDYTLLVALTSIGRATVDKLQLNREGLVNLRRVLVTVGEHPPECP
jgi:hypothetical protein